MLSFVILQMLVFIFFRYVASLGYDVLIVAEVCHIVLGILFVRKFKKEDLHGDTLKKCAYRIFITLLFAVLITPKALNSTEQYRYEKVYEDYKQNSMTLEQKVVDNVINTIQEE